MIEKIKEVREITNAKLCDCKKVLEKHNGDVQKAIDELMAGNINRGTSRINSNRDTTEGFVGSYMHANGKIGVLVELTCETDFVARNDQFRNLAKDLAMQIAAMNPIAVDRNSLPRELVDTKMAEARNSESVTAKPANLHERIIGGIMERWYREVCLMDQPFIREDKRIIKQMIEAASGRLGEAITVKRFVRFQIGD